MLSEGYSFVYVALLSIDCRFQVKQSNAVSCQSWKKSLENNLFSTSDILLDLFLFIDFSFSLFTSDFSDERSNGSRNRYREARVAR